MHRMRHSARYIVWIALLCAGLLGAAAGADTPTSVSLTPATQEVSPGGEFVLQVRIDDVADMLGADITLAFDPGRLRVQSISQGELFPAGESTSFYTIDNETGALDYAVTLLGMGNSISGSGILCEIRGQALALGDAPVTITKAELADTSFHLIPVVTSDAVVRVAAGRAYLPMVATSP